MNRITNTLVVVLALSVPVSSIAQTHFEIESQNLVSSDANISPAVDAYMTHALNNSRFGTFAWFIVGEHWAEGYAGLTFAPSSWCQIGLGFGLEQANNPWRVGGSIWVGRGRWSVLTLFEEGGSTFWHRVVANYKLNELIGVGGMSEEFVGIGPRVEMNIPKTPIQIWTSLLEKGGNICGYATLKFRF